MEHKKTQFTPSAFELDGAFLDAERYAVHCAIACTTPNDHSMSPEHSYATQANPEQVCARSFGSMLCLGSGSSGSGAGALGYGLELI